MKKETKKTNPPKPVRKFKQSRQQKKVWIYPGMRDWEKETEDFIRRNPWS